MDKPITFTVDRIRDGKSFTTRTVKAIQDGEAIFSCSVSFQKNEDGLEHQIEIESASISPYWRRDHTDEAWRSIKKQWLADQEMDT